MPVHSPCLWVVITVMAETWYKAKQKENINYEGRGHKGIYTFVYINEEIRHGHQE